MVRTTESSLAGRIAIAGPRHPVRSCHGRNLDKPRTQPHAMGVWMTIGVGVGAALGVSVFDDIAIGVGFGIAIGAAIGAAVDRRS